MGYPERDTPSASHDLHAGPARARRLAGPAALLATLLLVLLHAVALAVPPEPLHLPGIQDAADYDSVIQPLVLGLTGISVDAVPMVTPAGSSREPVRASIPTALPVFAAGLPLPRAPPLA